MCPCSSIIYHTLSATKTHRNSCPWELREAKQKGGGGHCRKPRVPNQNQLLEARPQVAIAAPVTEQPGQGAPQLDEEHRERWLKILQRLRLIVRVDRSWPCGLIGKGPPEKVPVGLKLSCEPRRSGAGEGGQSRSGESVSASWLLEGGRESGRAGMGAGRE